jgi:hypothetical protein
MLFPRQRQFDTFSAQQNMQASLLKYTTADKLFIEIKVRIALNY